MASKHLYIIAKRLYSGKVGKELDGVVASRIYEACGISRQTIINWGASDVTPQRPVADKFCQAAGISKEIYEAVLGIPWDVDVNEEEFYQNVVQRNLTYLKRLAMGSTFSPTDLIAVIESLGDDHLMKRLWEYRNKGDDNLQAVDRFTFFVGTARIIHQDFLNWIAMDAEDVDISIKLLKAIMDNLQIPYEERGWVISGPSQERERVQVVEPERIGSSKELRVQTD